jgi:3-isopropylmalate/(R)-2-methylmalate dehydratase small subunit
LLPAVILAAVPAAKSRLRLSSILGIGCILAESYARIFFRNAIAIGLPAMEVDGISSLVKAGDRISVDPDTGRIHGGFEGGDLQAVPLHPKMREIIEAGGIDGMLKRLGG